MRALCRASSTVAASLGEAFTRRTTATQLLLAGHEDVRCVNIMCERVGSGCACRLAQPLSRMPLLQVLDLSANALPTLPDEVLASLPALRELRLADNALTELRLPADSASMLGSLEVLDLRRNRLALVGLRLPLLEALPRLRALRLAGNAALETGAGRKALDASSLGTKVQWDA